MDNTKAELRETDMGKGLFAKEKISAGEEIASFDGPTYDDDYEPWTKDMSDHCIQLERGKWRDSGGFARFINHSCDPNCGIKDLFRVVAMRDIAPGEELTWDYEMTEDSEQWVLDCHCDSPHCRKKIGAFRNMPQETVDKYKGFISEWLVKEYPDRFES